MTLQKFIEIVEKCGADTSIELDTVSVIDMFYATNRNNSCAYRLYDSVTNKSYAVYDQDDFYRFDKETTSPELLPIGMEKHAEADPIDDYCAIYYHSSSAEKIQSLLSKHFKEWTDEDAHNRQVFFAIREALIEEATKESEIKNDPRCSLNRWLSFKARIPNVEFTTNQ